jgi:hypothetical protein
MVYINSKTNGTGNNIYDMLDLATSEEYSAGMDWYREAYEFCGKLRDRINGISASTKVRGVTLLDVACITALLSPRSKWERNKVDATNLLLSYASELPMEDVTIATFNANKKKAIDFLQAEPLCQDARLALVGVPGESKVPSFAWCIAHYSSTQIVCVDGHAISIWLGYRLKEATAKGSAYLRIQQDYIDVANKEGIAPHQVQAITWLTYRRLNKIK